MGCEQQNKIEIILGLSRELRKRPVRTLCHKDRGNGIEHVKISTGVVHLRTTAS